MGGEEARIRNASEAYKALLRCLPDRVKDCRGEIQVKDYNTPQNYVQNKGKPYYYFELLEPKGVLYRVYKDGFVIKMRKKED